MTNSKTTKRALISSALAILVCAAMLIGTTFAWFTDIASTSVNKIQSGTLSVDIVDKEGQSLDGKMLYFRDVEGKTDILWEPGATFNLDSFRIVNTGKLALKYKVVINGVNGNSELLDVIDFTVKKGDAAAEKLEGWEGALLPAGKEAVPDSGVDVGETDLITISGTMQESAKNDYQNKTLEGVSITVLATQYTYENDSKGNTYDDGAEYPVVEAGNLQNVLAELEDNAVISVNGTVEEALTIDKPVTIHNLTTTAPVTVTSNDVTLNAADIASTEPQKPAISVDKNVTNVTITNSVINANTGKGGSHTAVSIPVSGKVVFSGNTVSNSYNGVEFGLNTPVANGTVIENNNFVNIGNNAISIYQVAEGATVTIKNNTFSGKKDNYIPIRLSNSNNATGRFNIVDNTVDTASAWKNLFVLLQDYSKDGSQDFTKYTLLFQNNTVSDACTYTLVYSDVDKGLIDTNQPNVLR